MKPLDTASATTKRLGKNLRRMSAAAGEGVGDMASRAGKQLHDARDRLGDLEHEAALQMRRASRETQRYARKHPWQMVAGLAAVALAAAMVARKRMSGSSMNGRSRG